MTEYDFWKWIDSDDCPDHQRRGVMDAIKHFFVIMAYPHWKIRERVFTETTAKEFGYEIPDGPTGDRGLSACWDHYMSVWRKVEAEVMDYGDITPKNVQETRAKLRMILDTTVSKLVQDGQYKKAGRLAAALGRILLPATINVQKESHVYHHLPSRQEDLIRLVKPIQIFIDKGIVQTDQVKELPEGETLEADFTEGLEAKKAELKMIPRRPPGRPPKDPVRDMEKRLEYQRKREEDGAGTGEETTES